MVAKYLRLANILREQIKSNIHGTNRKLPTEEALAARYGVSRQTVREALKVLASEGLIEKRQGSGTYIAEHSNKDTSDRVAILISSDSEYIYPELIADMRSVLKKNGYFADIFVTEDSIKREGEHLNTILKGGYAGMIVEPVKSAYPSAYLDVYDKIRNRGMHVIFMGEPYSNFPDMPHASGDDVYGAYLLCKMLLDRNHSGIACLLNRDAASGLLKYQGILMAYADKEMTPDDNLCTWYSSEDIMKLRKRQDISFLSDFVRMRSGGVNAVICMNDEVAYWLVKELKSRNMEIPTDISVVSFDNSYLSSFDTTKITSMSHNAHELGRSVTTGLVKLMKGQPFSSQKLTWHMVSRGSESEK